VAWQVPDPKELVWGEQHQFVTAYRHQRILCVELFIGSRKNCVKGTAILRDLCGFVSSTAVVGVFGERVAL